MSRILRRPMFRGGRVDGRGTGITSGLGYEKGGSVNIPKRGLVDGPGGYAGLSLAEQRAKLAYEKPGTTKYTDNYVLDRLNEYKGNLYTGGIPDVDIEYGMQLIPPISDERQAQINYMTDTPKEFEKNFYEGKLPGADTNYNKLQSDQLAAAKLAGDEDLFNLLTKKDTPVLSANVNTNTETGEQSSDDLLDIDKEKFAKLLGGDKARGEDISNMLMSFAGKALKPEATVKGAFGEFFEEEAKRPSSKTKVDQAAAQLAINKYIKGEISKAEMEKLVMLNRTKISDQIELQKAALTLDTALQAGVKNGVGSSKKSIAVIQSAVEQVYGDKFNFGGPLPETAEEINVSTIYVKDNEKSSGAKDLVYIDPTTGNLEILKTIF